MYRFQPAGEKLSKKFWINQLMEPMSIKFRKIIKLAEPLYACPYKPEDQRPAK
jgi:hypothetical protein